MDEAKKQEQLPVGTDKFAKPVELSGVIYTHYQMREATLDDMLDVELELSQTGRGTHTPLAFNGEMMMRQLTRVFNDQGKEFKGPFTLNILRIFGPRNYRVLRTTQMEIDVLGEAE